MEKWGIHWFRRDLRVAGNSALQWNWKKSNGRVVGLFCFDSKFLSRPDFSHNRFAFFMKTLLELKSELESIGSDLWVVDCLPAEAFPKIGSFLRSQNRSFSRVSYNRDYEPFARERDAKVTEILQESLGVEVYTDRDHLLIEPWEIDRPQNSNKNFYQVFTPFSRRWYDQMKGEEVQNRLEIQKKGLHYLKARAHGKIERDLFKLKWKTVWAEHTPPLPDTLHFFIDQNQPHVTIPIPEAGSLTALKKLDAFKTHLSTYGQSRDIPGVDGTSKLSIFLKNGSLTVPQIITELDLSTVPFKSEGGSTKYLKELIWREFYYSILFHRPGVEKGAFLERYQNILWENNPVWFEAWKQGQTGYPIVDAGMRQLKQEGWMHNRVRMIVASFLTKDLLIDWRWGENYFMKELLDGDLAPNNGGWQWAASTGCDPQPYFRIFNPELQSLKFDPNGDYIRKYVPELSKVPTSEIHAPFKVGKLGKSQRGLFNSVDYPEPIVEHAQQKIKALALYKDLI